MLKELDVASRSEVPKGVRGLSFALISNETLTSLSLGRDDFVLEWSDLDKLISKIEPWQVVVKSN